MNTLPKSEDAGTRHIPRDLNFIANNEVKANPIFEVKINLIESCQKPLNGNYELFVVQFEIHTEFSRSLHGNSRAG